MDRQVGLPKERLPSISSLDLPRPGSIAALTPNSQESLVFQSAAETQLIVAALSRRFAYPSLEIRSRTQPDQHDLPPRASTPNTSSIFGPHVEDISQMQASQEPLEAIHRRGLFFASQQGELDNQGFSSRTILDGLEDACMPPTLQHPVTSLCSPRSSNCSTPEPTPHFLHSTRTGRVTKNSAQGRSSSPGILPKDESAEEYIKRHSKKTKEKLSRKEQGKWGKLLEECLLRQGVKMEHRLNKGNADRSHGNTEFKKIDYLMESCRLLLRYEQLPEHLRRPTDEYFASTLGIDDTFFRYFRRIEEALTAVKMEEDQKCGEMTQKMKRAGRPQYKTKKASLRRTARRVVVTPPESEASSSSEASSPSAASSPRYASKAPSFDHIKPRL